MGWSSITSSLQTTRWPQHYNTSLFSPLMTLTCLHMPRWSRPNSNVLSLRRHSSSVRHEYEKTIQHYYHMEVSLSKELKGATTSFWLAIVISILRSRLVQVCSVISFRPDRLFGLLHSTRRAAAHKCKLCEALHVKWSKPLATLVAKGQIHDFIFKSCCRTIIPKPHRKRTALHLIFVSCCSDQLYNQGIDIYIYIIYR